LCLKKKGECDDINRNVRLIFIIKLKKGITDCSMCIVRDTYCFIDMYVTRTTYSIGGSMSITQTSNYEPLTLILWRRDYKFGC